MVVDVVEVRHDVLVHHVQVAAQHAVQHLAHGQHHPAQQDQRLAQLERAPLHVLVPRVVVEELVLQRLNLAVQFLDRLEVGVHHVVEQPVQQEADATFGQVR